MQVICEEKNYKFCASNEDSLAKWLGAFKSLLVKKKDVPQTRIQQATPNTINIQPATPSLLPSPMSPTQQPLAIR
jgi:hypothetical protein